MTDVRNEELFVSLTEAEADKILDEALEQLVSGDEEMCRELLSSLVCYREYNISRSLPKLIEHGMYYPGILFKDAGPEVRDRLLQQLEWDVENFDFLLPALSWIGDTVVVTRFQEWRKNPPSWAEELPVPPEQYTYAAGWELGQDGTRVDLIRSPAYAILRRKEPSAAVLDSGEPGKFLLPDRENCPWCGGKLTTLMDVDAHHPSLSGWSLRQERLHFKTCMRCGCYSTIFMKSDDRGVASWSEYNEKPGYMPEIDLGDYGEEYLNFGPLLELEAKPRLIFHTAVWGLTQTNSQIGGHPSWIQDAEYPACPCCGESMHFIAQLDWSELEEYGEGILYMFLCEKDKLTATLFQQS
ncbi:DUF1963 domain-containing protein [Paenibacillus sp. A14]|uniref:DUF1963 domain-containing protein n=1 Tax=Paenibacillus sp. A14 TaxID=3119820 RepID=UPI002FE1D80C